MARLTLSNSDRTVLVDEEDVALLSQFRWRLHSRGYASAGKGNSVLMHRFLLGLGKGDRRQADHVNHDRLDNRRENLRIATNGQNCQNRSVIRGESRFKGVHFHKRKGKWTAYIKTDRQVHLGYFATEEEAARAYDEAARNHYGEFFLPNFPLAP